MKQINGEFLTLDQAYEKHHRLIGPVLRRYEERGERFGLENSDLWNMGCIGFILAYERYEESKGCRFSTFATQLIHFTIGNEIKRNSGSFFRFSETIKTYAYKYKKAGYEEVDIDLIRKEFGISYQMAYEVVCYMLLPQPLSLDIPLMEGSRTFMIHDSYGKADDDSEVFVNQISEQFEGMEKKVFDLLMQGYTNLSQIGRKLKVSHTTVATIKGQIQEKVESILQEAI